MSMPQVASAADEPSPLRGKIDDSHGPITEDEAFEIYYRTSRGESDYSVAKSLGVSAGAVSRILNGDVRAGRKPRAPYAERLASDIPLKLRYEMWVKNRELVFESKEWSREDFNSLPIIQRWRESISLRGSPSALENIAEVRRVCTGGQVSEFRCNPEKFTLDLDAKKDSPVRKFVLLYLKETGKQKVPARISIAIRDFLASCHNITIPRNFGHQYGLSGAKDHYGKHNMKMLTNSQWLAILKILLEAGDLRLAAKASVGCEGFPRSETLDLLNPSSFRETRREIDGLLCTYLKFDKFEKKTAKHRQAPFTVEILHPLAAEITRAYLEVYKPREHMFVSFDGHWSRELSDGRDNRRLRELYGKLGITDSYYLNYPTYTFRHTGAKRWVRRCGGDLTIVKKRGWLDAKTLEDCYAGMEDEDDFEAKTCYECKPPKYPTIDEERFCGLKCCLLYFTKHRDEILADFLPMLEAARAAR